MATGRKKTKRRPEAAAQKAILETLQRLGYWCWRNNAGVMVVGTGSSRRVIRMSPAGSPDIFVVLSSGRLCGIECKAPGGKQSALQKAWQERAIESHVGYRVVWTLGEAVTAVSAWSVGAL